MKKQVCKYCGQNFEHINRNAYANHVRWCEKNPNTDKEKHSRDIKIRRSFELDKKLGKITEFQVECFKCGKPFKVKERKKQFPKKKKYFCSKSCASSRSGNKKWLENRISKEFKQKMSNSMQEKWTDSDFAARCIKNSKKYFSSKGECEVRKIFQGKYPEDGWTQGGHLKVKTKGITRDMYSNKLKVCVEYDGIWHFKDIKGQLSEKHKKDLLLEQWCLDNGWRLIRIDEHLYQTDKEYWIEKLEQEIYHGTEQIVKFWSDDNIRILKESVAILNKR